MIPVPGVCEVSGYEDRGCLPFHRPNSYISLDGDEVSRALAKRTANYGMDSEDEKWLKKFNNEFFFGNGHCEHLSEDCLELMFDAFEKAYFCSPDDYSTENAAHLCLYLGSRAVVEAVHAYWLSKRKQRRSALLRVFQHHQLWRTSDVAPATPPPSNSGSNGGYCGGYGLPTKAPPAPADLRRSTGDTSSLQQWHQWWLLWWVMAYPPKGHQVKKAPLVPKPILQKRRSFKRQTSHGKGKQPSLLQALAAEHDDELAEQNAMVNTEEARVSASQIC